MLGLSMEWQTCPEGVTKIVSEDRVEVGHTSMPAGAIYTYRSDNRVPVFYRLDTLENTLCMRFINAVNEEDRIKYLSANGIPVEVVSPFANKPFPVGAILPEEIDRWQHEMRNVFEQINNSPSIFEASQRLNQALETYHPMATVPFLDFPAGADLPRVSLEARTPYMYMLMEVAVIVASGARQTACERCDKWFLTGPQTGRRSHARFCSDRCRVAAMRKRKASEAQ